MGKIEIIKQQEVLGKDFKVYGDYDNPLFLAKDVANWIEHSNATAMLNSVDSEEKVVIKTPTNNCLEGMQSNTEYTFLTENGLYEVLMLSRKPIAKDFKKEVKKILKSIRTHGAYMTPETIEQTLTNPDFIIQLATTLKAEQEKNKALTTTVAVQEQQITELKPKANYYDVILNCPDLLSVTKIAKDYGKSARWLNNYLHLQGIQFKQGDIWLLYQKYAEQGYTSTKTHDFCGDDGQQHSKVNTYWTQKGRLFIYDLLKANGIMPVMEQIAG